MDYRPTFIKLPADAAWPGDHGYPPYLFDDDIAVAVDVPLAMARPPARWPARLARRATLIHWDPRTTAGAVRRAVGPGHPVAP